MSQQWGLDPSEVKNHLLGDKWGGDLDLPALIRHLDGIQQGMWTKISLPPTKTHHLLLLLGDAGYETQIVTVHDKDTLYVRRPLEEA